jgi:hypothetical protein
MGFSVRAFLIGQDGRIDTESTRRQLSLAAGSLELPSPEAGSRRVIQAEHIFNRRRYQREFSWNLSCAQREQLLRVISEHRHTPPTR